MFLIDGSQIMKRDGTGIASYTRSLAATLQSPERPVALLLDRRVSTTRPLPPLELATQVFGNLPARPKAAAMMELLVRSRFGLSRNVTARLLDTTAMRLASLDPPLPPHEAVFNLARGMEQASAVFSLRGRLTRVTVPAPVTIAHWSGPFPIRVQGAPNVYTLHDMIPLQMPHLVLDRPGLALRRFQAVADTADHIIAVSEQVREDIVATLGVPADRISVTYQPVPEIPRIDREASERLVRDVYGAEPGGYVFFCGAMEPKKNLYRLIEAFTIAGVGLKLLIAGPLGWLYDDVSALLEQFAAKTIIPARRQVRWLGYLPRMHLAALMKCARFFAFPSIYEGFGLPVAEALQLGVPVLTSAAGGLMEVAGDAALMVNPLDVADIARKIRLITSDADLRNELSLRGPVQAARFSRAAHLRLLDTAYRRVGVTMPMPVEVPAPTPEAASGIGAGGISMQRDVKTAGMVAR